MQPVVGCGAAQIIPYELVRPSAQRPHGYVPYLVLMQGGAQEKERSRAQKHAETEGWTERRHVTKGRKTHAALGETNELEKGPCSAGVENLGQVVSLGGRLIVVLYEAAVDLDVEQRLALLCRLVFILARGLAVACHQVTHLHPGYVGVVFSIA